jgi:hypothetical protein
MNFAFVLHYGLFSLGRLVGKDNRLAWGKYSLGFYLYCKRFTD